MKSFASLGLYLTLSVTFLSQPLRAQAPSPFQSTGLPNTIYNAGVVDSVDTTSGNLRITIPLVHLPGRGLDTDIVLSYNSKVWITNESIDPNTGYSIFQAFRDADSGNGPVINGPAIGWSVGVPRMGSYGNGAISCQQTDSYGGCIKQVEYLDWVMTDGTRSFMQDDVGVETCLGGPCPAGIGAWSYDGTYLRFPATPNGGMSDNRVGRYKDGVKVTLPAANDSLLTQTLTDTNGNFISCTTSGCTDTLGRVISYTYEHLTSPIITDRLQSVSYKDSSGALQTITFGYQTIGSYYPMTWLSGGQYTALNSNSCPYNNWCYLTDGSDGSAYWLLTSITLPNGKTYQFEYLPNVDTDAAGQSTGLVSKITLPTGGYMKYGYANGDAYAQYTAISSRVVSSDGSPTSEKTSAYAIGGGVPNSNSQITDPLGNIQVIHFDANGWAPSTITYKNSSGTALRTITRTTGCDETTYNNVDGYVGWKCSNARTLSEIKTLNDSNQQSKVTFTYGTRGNVTAKSEYDWGMGAPGSLIRTTTFAYLHDSDTSYDTSSVHILDRVTSLNVCNSAGTFCSEKMISYDGAAPTSTNNVVGHDYSNYSSSFTKRGNPTLTQNWLNTTSTWLQTTNVYNDVGNLLQTTDPGLHTTSFNYSDNYYNYSPTQPTSAFVSQTTRPATNGVNHISKSQYYFYSGLRAADCGENFPGGTGCSYNLALPQADYSEFTYDSLNRSLITTGGDGGQVTLTYNEGSLPISITKTTKVTSTLNKIESNTYDGLGRDSQQKLTSDPQGTVFTDTTYDALGRVATVSNPYRTSSDPGPTNGITTYVIDALNRVTRLAPPDGNPTTGANTVNTTYSGNCSTITDQAAKVRKSCADAFGRVIQVFEPDVSNNLVNETDYTYDVLGNLLTVNQKGNDSNSADWRTRTFAYDSLSQLTSATNPETGPIGSAGTITYTYNADGVLISKTDGRGVTINYSPSASPIDALHRVTEKTYSDSTPTIRYAYDGVAPSGCTLPSLTIHNGIGKRTGMCDAAGAEAWSWDITSGTGWQVTDVRTTNGVTKTSISQSNFDGSLATLTYPSGRVLTYALAYSGTSTASHAASAIDSTGPINYLTSALYSPQGALSYAQNGSGFFTTFLYNSRLQPCWIYSNTSTTGLPSACTQTGIGNAAIMDVQYNFALSTSDNGNVNRVANRINGNRSITYQYDELNRIHDAATDATSGTFCWGQLFGTQSGGTFTSGYDPWGNLRTITPDPNRPGCSANSLSRTVNAYNKLVDTGYSYDSAGNMIADPGGTYSYNGENQLTSAGAVTYTYDGDGKRIQKSNGKLYWYGMNQDALDETDAAGNTNNASFNEYVFFNGKRIARRDYSNNLFYYFSDHLGTSREIVQPGQTTPCYDADYYPFGGEAVVVTNTCSQNYKFTGKERDSESGLDNFGARYNSSSMGRFMSPDDPFADQDSRDPQSWNLYSYVRNNPLNDTDPTGNACVSNGNGGYVNDNSGGQSCADVDQADKKVNPQAIVNADAGSAASAFVLNFLINLSNAANDYFRVVTNAMGVEPSYMQNIPTGSGAAAGTGAGAATAATFFIGPEAEGINITAEGLAHVAEGHMVGGAKAVLGKKSVFSAAEDVKGLIKAAEGVRPTRMGGGDFARVVDAGRPIGIDRATGAPTSTYTVITKPNGSLVNAFPGKP
jgi:RHS repeat-associated protein